MMKKINTNSYWAIQITLFAILIIGLFYWFQWRPSEIRKECSKYSIPGYLSSRVLSDQSEQYQSYLSSRISSDRSEQYQKCLHERGL